MHHAREPKPIMIDRDGVKWWNFLYSYEWEGATYSFSIAARSKEEADARRGRLPLARYDGQQDGAPIPFARGGFLTPLVSWWRNLRRA